MAGIAAAITTGQNAKLGRGGNNGPRRSVSAMAGLSGMAKMLKGIGQLCRRCRNGDCGVWWTPFFVPAEQPIELFFFQRIFDNLCERLPCPRDRETTGAQDAVMQVPNLGGGDGSETGQAGKQPACQRSATSFLAEPAAEREVPLVQFHRAMVRLFRILKQPSPEVRMSEFAIDTNSNGKVGWYEFCSFWKENRISVRLTWAERLFLTLEDAERSIAGRIMSILVFVAILISTGCFILSTVPEYQSKCPLENDPDFEPGCKPQTSDFFQEVDLYCVIFFSIEYGLRLLLSGVMRCELVDRNKNQLLEWMVTENTIREPSHIRRVSDFFFHPANLIDLAAIMPWFLSEAFKNSGGEDSLIIRLIRLTRVIRAFRLGSRFEAVIIIVRSIRRSLRALYVLVLNLTLGVIIFGALMYFCEQGTWDKEKKTYVRWRNVEFNESLGEWQKVYEKSPFESIPACFWWAIVTATTVGYGDLFPTTPAGKVVAGVSMAWSLCVLALPIGVIGSNFSEVWTEYDHEKAQQEWNNIKEEMMLKRSIAWGDPLHYSRRILLEVWHDPGLSDDDQAEFMGEVDISVELPAKEPKTDRKTYPLTANYEKARRRVRGQLTIEYVWRPSADKGSPDTLLHGALEILVLAGEDLISIDWKGSCSSDPYCVVVGYPRSPSLDGRVEPVWFRTDTCWDTSNPYWNFRVVFDVHWTQSGTANCMAADMRQIGNSIDNSSVVASAPSRRSMRDTQEERPVSPPKSQANPEEALGKMVPELEAELIVLKEKVVPQIQDEIKDVRQDLQLILQALRRRSNHTNGAALAESAQGSATGWAAADDARGATTIPDSQEPSKTVGSSRPASGEGDRS